MRRRLGTALAGLTLGFVALLLFGLIVVAPRVFAVAAPAGPVASAPSASAAPLVAATNRAPAARPPAAAAALQGQIETYLAQQSGTYGVAVADAAGNPLIQVNAGRIFDAASTYKVLVMYRVYQQIESGSLTVKTPITIAASDAYEGTTDGGLAVGDTTSVGTALDLMITVSSNTAALALVRTLGGWSVVTSAAAELGMSNTSLASDGTFLTTPDDMSSFFGALARGQLLSPADNGNMVALLAGQTVNDRLPADLPPGTVIAHKTGNLPGVRNDVGIVYAPGGTYVISAFGEGDVDEATAVIAHVSRLVYDYYSGQ